MSQGSQNRTKDVTNLQNTHHMLLHDRVSSSMKSNINLFVFIISASSIRVTARLYNYRCLSRQRSLYEKNFHCVVEEGLVNNCFFPHDKFMHLCYVMPLKG